MYHVFLTTVADEMVRYNSLYIFTLQFNSQYTLSQVTSCPSLLTIPPALIPVSYILFGHFVGVSDSAFVG